MEIQVWWFSSITNKQEMVFAKNLEPTQRDSLLWRILNYQDWSELKNLVEKHESTKISYLVSGVRVSGKTTVVNIITQRK